MTTRWLESSARSGWLAGAVAGAALTLAALIANYTPDAHSAASPAAAMGSFADVIESVSPAVVNISVTKAPQALPTASPFGWRVPEDGRGRAPGPQSPLDEFFGRFFEMPGQPMPEPRMEGQGSGFLIDPSGYVVTNNHVIDGADEIVVTLQDGRKLDATLIGRDAKTDLAVIKVSSSGLPHVVFGDSDAARVGDWVVAIGNPFGLGGTATAGIISARGRDIQSGPYDDYLQIDAPINRGNSGGPVFNVAGEVVGVNTAIFSPNGGNIGIGFAIPANQAKAVIDELKARGSVERGWLGVQIQSLDEDLAASFGLDDERGALVTEVVRDGPAERGGVLAGDVITHFNGREIDSARTLSRAVGDADPDDTARITVWRDGRSRELSVELGEAAAEPVAAATPGAADGTNALGLALRNLTDQDKADLGVPAETEGAVVVAVAPGSAAAEKGIRVGDVITRVNQTDVASADAAVAALNQAKAGNQRALLLVRRGDSQRFVALSFS
jgi:serine protease Do